MSYDLLATLEVPGWAPIERYQPLLMTSAEREAVPLGHNAEWIDQQRTTALLRWLGQPAPN